MSDDVTEMRCAIYARYSSDLQRETSIEDQVAKARQFARDRGWTVLEDHVYADYAVSGAVTARAQLDRLLRCAKEAPRPFEYVLVDDTSRLSRTPGHVEHIAESLRYHEVHLYFVSQGIDTKDRNADLSVGVHGLIDSQYRRDLGQKTVRGMSGQVSRGYNPGGRVYGYRYIKELDPSGTLDRKTKQTRVIGTRIEIDPEQKNVVREIFEMYARGLTIGEVTRYLNDKGYPPPSNKQQSKRGRKPTWIQTTVRNHLSNRKYIGDWTFNKQGWVKDPETGRRKLVDKPKSEWTVNQRNDLKIIDRFTWEQVQERLQANKTGPQGRRRSPQFLFSGMMKCHECGGSYVLYSSSRNRDPMFGCATNIQRGSEACPNGLKVRKSEIETKILADLQNGLLSRPVLTAIVNKVNEKLKARIRKLQRGAGKLELERAELVRKEQHLIDAIEDGFASDELRSRLTEIVNRRQVIDRQQSLLNKKLDWDKLKVDDEWVEKWLSDLREILNQNPAVAKAKLMSLIGPFTLTPTEIDGVLHLRADSKAKALGVLEVALGRQFQQIRQYWGTDLNRRPPDPQSGVLTN